MFSVIIPLYNKEEYIKRAINSVLNQTFQQFEIIIVNDGSTDRSVEKVKEIKDSRVRLINQENQGVSAARNRGIKEAKYDFIAFLDADDEWEKDYLKTIVTLIKKYPECKVFATNYKIVESNGNIRYPRINGLPKNFKEGVISSETYFEVASKSDPILCSSTVCVVKNAINKIGGFPVGVKGGEDLITWAKLMTKNKLAFNYKKHLAIFYRNTNIKNDNNSKNYRIVSYDKDIVAKELMKLYKEYQLEGLKQYIAYWFKIKINIFLRAKEYELAKKEFIFFKKYSKKNFKFFFYLFLLNSPVFIKKLIIKNLWGEL
ncbi:glycosyltransferase family 2 protein [Caminibacter mediatlanticus]|uniref:glycosyltransferase family 2 protein n=1 Tax=Caminibacter mediatlanticus TaxID=291048 RepID=UPI0015863C45|nr:glycosyltransferase family 2 protein [Caminibacter mediatlanticus]